MGPLNPEEINRLNAAFWDEQNREMTRRLGDRSFVRQTVRTIRSEIRGKIPVSKRRCFPELLKAAEQRRAVLSAAGVRGGRVTKTDCLQQYILTWARLERGSWKVLLRRLVSGDGSAPSATIRGENLIFLNAQGQEKMAPISGLKDRLSRARQTLRTLS